MAKVINGSIGRTDSYKLDPKAVIVRDGWNPRTDFDDGGALKASIKAMGVLTPIRVKLDEDRNPVLIDGERRVRAVLELMEEGHHINHVPAIVEGAKISPVDEILMALASNEGKRLNAIEEARAYAMLVAQGLKVDEIATMVGKSKVHLYERLKLADAPDALQQAVINGHVEIKQAVKLVKDKVVGDALTAAIEAAHADKVARATAKVEARKATMQQQEPATYPTNDAGLVSVPPTEAPEGWQQVDPGTDDSSLTPEQGENAYLALAQAVAEGSPQVQAAFNTNPDHAHLEVAPTVQMGPKPTGGNFEKVVRVVKPCPGYPCFDKEEAEALLQEAIGEFSTADMEDAKMRAYAAGKANILAMLLGVEDPIEAEFEL